MYVYITVLSRCGNRARGLQYRLLVGGTYMGYLAIPMSPPGIGEVVNLDKQMTQGGESWRLVVIVIISKHALGDKRLFIGEI